MNVEYKQFSSKRHFGIELEVGNNISQAAVRDLISEVSSKSVRVTEWEKTNNNSYWHVKKDSTCGPKASATQKDYGIEIASYVACGLKEIVHIAKVSDFLKQNGVLVNDNCGLHIHADISDFNASQAAILLAWWIKIEPLLCCIVPERRVNNVHCKLWTKFKKIDLSDNYTAENFWNLMRPTNFNDIDNKHKKVTLNFVNFAASLIHGEGYRRTVELRWPEGTLDGKDIANWIKLYLNFIDAAKNYSMPIDLEPITNLEELFHILNLNSQSNFYILSKGLRRLKIWILERVLKMQTLKGRKAERIYQEAEDKLKNILVNEEKKFNSPAVAE